jgi:hypothetical protein
LTADGADGADAGKGPTTEREINTDSTKELGQKNETLHYSVQIPLSNPPTFFNHGPAATGASAAGEHEWTRGKSEDRRPKSELDRRWLEGETRMAQIFAKAGETGAGSTVATRKHFDDSGTRPAPATWGTSGLTPRRLNAKVKKCHFSRTDPFTSAADMAPR